MTDLRAIKLRSWRFRSWYCGLALPIFTILLGGSGCSTSETLLKGEAFYRERIALPADAVFEAVLEDVSRADAPAEVLGRARLDPAGSPPFHFAIEYDENAIQSSHRYAVRASIRQQKQVLFTNAKSYPVLNGSQMPLKLLLVSARGTQRRVNASASDANGPSSVNVAKYTGLFSYMADAAIISLCSDHKRIPVAMEGDYLALESAYLQTRQQPGEALLVEVEGTVEMRPSAEEGAPHRPTLIVKRFIHLSTSSNCQSMRNDTALRNTYWKLIKLGNKPVVVANKNRQEPHLILSIDQPRVSGSGGCNRLMGGFKTDGDQLSFSQLASTMMACPDGMELEHEFLKSLEKVARYRITGNALDMLDEAGNLVARFEGLLMR